MVDTNSDQGQNNHGWIDDCYPLSMLTVLSEIKENKQFCDITIKVESQNFAAHRIVLCCLSPYFKALLSSEFAESKQDEIELKGCDAETFQLVLNFAYTASIIFTKLNAISLLVAADHFQVLNLKSAVASFLEDNNFDDSNCLELFCIADMVHSLNLKETCKSFILRDFANLCKQKAFLNLDTELLINLISSDDLILDEESVFKAVYLWLVSDLGNREKDIVKVLETVRLDLLSPYFLVELAEKYHHFVSNSDEALQLYRETFYSLLLPDRKTKITVLKNKPRKMIFDRVGLAIIENDLWFLAKEHIIWKYNVRFDQFEQLNEMLLIKSSPGLAYYGGFLYAVGCNTINRYIERYDLKTKVWNLVKILNKTSDLSSRNTLMVAKNKLYAKDARLQYFDIVELGLENLSKCTTKEKIFRRNTQGDVVCVKDSYIYVIGGGMKEVERYNVDTDEWMFVSPMLTERSYPGVAVRDGKIYVSGGGHDTVEVYDPCQNFWSVCDYPYSIKWPITVPSP